MKSYKEIEKKYTPEEIAESIVFPGTKNTKEREAILSEFREFRKSMLDKKSAKAKKALKAKDKVGTFFLK